MKTSRFVLPLLILLPALSFGSGLQSTEEKGAKSDAIVTKMRQLDVLNHVLPLILTKAQLNTILASIEKARTRIKLLHDQEYKRLVGFDDPSSVALGKAINDGLVPDKALVKQMFEAVATMTQNRRIIGQSNIAEVTEAVTSVINGGQKKIMMVQLDPKSFDPNFDPDKMTDSEKIRFYVENVLLDPVAYDVLVKLSISKATADK